MSGAINELAAEMTNISTRALGNNILAPKILL